MAAKAKPRRRGFQDGGQVLSTDSLGKSIMGGAQSMANIYSSYQRGRALGAMADAPKKGTIGDPDAGRGASPPVDNKDSYARGGPIKRVAGKPIGKDDGLIPAQRGEYVVKKSAVQKLGTKTLNQINKGQLPTKKRS